MRQRAAQMRGDAFAAQEKFDSSQRDPCLDLLMHEVVRDTVVMLGDLDMIIEIDPTPLPLGVLVWFVRQRCESGSIELIE